MRLPSCASNSPSADSNTAPTGTSPRAAADFASSSASAMASASFMGTGVTVAGKQKPAEREGERIAKVIARAGICSRRDAEKLIAEGRVALGGEKVMSPALNVAPDALITV